MKKSLGPNIYFFLLSFFSSIFILSCDSKHNNKLERSLASPNDISLAEALNTPETITFSLVKKLVLTDNCTSCHNSEGAMKANVAVNSHEELFGLSGGKTTVKPFSPEESSLYNTLILPSGPRHMPPFNKPQLSGEQISLVYQWISNGAKKELSQKVETPKTLAQELQPYFEKPETIDYGLVNKYIFSKTCNECHSWDGSKADIDGAISYTDFDTTDYQSFIFSDDITGGQLVNSVQQEWVTDENGQRTQKTKKIKGSTTYKAVAINLRMPPTEDGYPLLNIQLVKLLRLWILNCGIENYDQIKNDTLLDPIENEDVFLTGKVRNCHSQNKN